MTETVAFAVASALHAGFQVTVTVLVYPALAEVDASGWDVAHARHARRIAPLVAAVYAALLATGAGVMLDGPDGPDGPDVAGWLGLAGAAGALTITATLAAPAHARLTAHDDRRVRHLLRVDRFRCGCAVVGAVAAVVGVTTG